MKKFIFVLLLGIASLAQASETIKFNSYGECARVEKELEVSGQNFKLHIPPWDKDKIIKNTKIPDYWWHSDKFGKSLMPPRSSGLGSLYIKNGKIINIFCAPYPNQGDMTIRTYEEDFELYQKQLAKEAQEKQAAQDLLRKNGL
jgi:hypothetical protein